MGFKIAEWLIKNKWWWIIPLVLSFGGAEFIGKIMADLMLAGY